MANEPVLKTIDHRTLYEQDLVAWFDDTVTRLKAGKLHEVDIDSLIEEIEGLAGRDRRELKSRLRVLLAHLLKRIYVEASDNDRGWEATIRAQRQQLLDLLDQSPSLRNDFAAFFSKCWADALASVREDYPQTEFSQEWELNQEIDALLSEKFWK